jgi:putative protease
MEVPISTQVNITIRNGLCFYALFADTKVLSRELSITLKSKKSVIKLKMSNSKGLLEI